MFEISYKDGTKIGILESRSFYDIQEGENEIKLVFNPHSLPSSEYYINLDAYEINIKEKYLTVDHPLVDIPFTIIGDEPKSIVWQHAYMGHVRLGKLHTK